MDAQRQFDTAARAAIVAEYRRQAQEPHRPNYSPLGCLLALLAIAIFFGGPWAVAKLGFHLPQALRITLLLVVIGMVIAGVVVYCFGSGGGYHRACHRAKESIEGLGRHYATATAEQRRIAAVTAILQAYYSDGPSMTTTYDVDLARTKLGNALPYVEAVEGVLRQDLRVHPVFTQG